MKHLGEDELVEMYYGEGTSDAGAHLKACRECAAQFSKLKQSLDAIEPEAVPLRGADFGERMWKMLEPQLNPYEKKRAISFGWAQWKFAIAAIGCAAVLVAVFFGGRYWERNNAKKADIATNVPAGKRVVVVVVTDHLDRTERLLVQLKHADLQDKTENAELQSEARELLASNRLYRTAANKEGDPVLAGALDRLEGVLAEIANDPNLTAADLERVQKDMNSDGVLFEIRVLLTRSPDQRSGTNSAKGAQI